VGWGHDWLLGCLTDRKVPNSDRGRVQWSRIGITGAGDSSPGDGQSKFTGQIPSEVVSLPVQAGGLRGHGISLTDESVQLTARRANLCG
jgi:hypothetical protein